MNRPTVTAIMPTRNRREFVPGAIACFFSQDWPNKELIVIDDGVDRIGDLIPDGGLVRYYHLQDRRSIGQKRNIACSRAKGEVIVHWDDDDFSAPGRTTDQVNRLLESVAPVTGYNSILFADDEARRAWRYLGEPKYAVGTSLCYRRGYWMSYPFIDIDSGEDNNFVQRATNISVADGSHHIVARIHSGNTSESYRGIHRQRWTGAQGECWVDVDYEGLVDIGYPVKERAIAVA